MIMSGLFLVSCRVTHSMKSSSEPQDRSSTQLTPPTVNAGMVTERSVQCLQFGCALKILFWSLMNSGVGTGTPFPGQEVSGQRQTQVKPNAHRGCSIKLVNHTQP